MRPLKILAALAACLPALAAAQPIVVGQSAPLTGSNAEIGKDIRDGAAAWFKRVNEAGGINGRKVELVSLDDRNDRKTAGANTVKLVNENGAVALFGFASATLSLDAMPVVKERKVPFFAPFTGADAIHKQNGFVFVMRASYADELEKILEHWKNLGVTRVTVVNYDDEIGNQNYATVARIMERAGKKAVGVKLKRNAPVEKAQIDAIIASDPEVVVATTLYGATAQVIKGLKAAGKPYNMTSLSFVGPSQLAKEAGQDAAGVSVAGVVPPPAKAMVPVIKECGEAIRKAGLPELNYTNLEACIAAKVLTEAMRRAGREVTRESLYKALNGLGSLDVGGYVVNFGPASRHGNRYVELAVIGRNGQFRF
ncbi:MAG TPA: ABC transporter substrate-binding protein [Usitatibacteraceae bacterium]|jgi:ABC-type branched-subunit amino acid transport system substrate-binding protein|nr:ABC transporter substrate-binding protein [Usitatibacteraceae bacterium]HRA23733.1 ABC transporter substrate-binding protein [Usitatibacteraceae bacterium]